MPLRFFIAACLCAAPSVVYGQSTDDRAKVFTEQVQPLLSRHCMGCHGADAQEGGVSYAELTDAQTALRRRKLWQRAVLRVKSGEMPPAGEPPLPAADKQTLVDWMTFAGDYLDCSDAARDPGPTVLRRLTRSEYDRTVRDLLGIEFRSGEAVGMPEEGVFEGFDNTSAALGFSPSLMEKHLAAADKLIELLGSPQHRSQLEKLLIARPSAENGLGDEAAARQVAAALVRRAYRGPCDDGDLQPLLAIFRTARERGATYDAAILALLKPVLVSPRFLYRLELGAVDAQQAGGNGSTPVSGHELAVRLSYFLWSSMPDETLFELADRGELLRPDVLREQALRMLKDPKARALTDEFAVQWLQLKKLDQARPQREFFPTFTHELRSAMREETIQFVEHLRRDDRSVLDLLDADYTFVNGDLAKHYGLAGPIGNEFQKVALRPADHRGGLLGMGSVLAMTSHTFRTSPTLRGKYILDVMLGAPVPPPPPDAGMIKEEGNDKQRLAATFREQLAQHASNKSCMGCHKKLDPLGFALDNYNPIGGWRESRPEFPLDVKAELPGGEKVSGAAELKQLLLHRKDEFARNLSGKLLSYALGRELDYYDDCALRDIDLRLKGRDYRFSELILGIVESRQFQYRRVGE